MAIAAHEGSIVEYAKTNNLKTKDIFHWKTSLTKRGFLPSEPEAGSDFVIVASNSR